jgi:hypothetical protein
MLKFAQAFSLIAENNVRGPSQSAVEHIVEAIAANNIIVVRSAKDNVVVVLLIEAWSARMVGTSQVEPLVRRMRHINVRSRGATTLSGKNAAPVVPIGAARVPGLT